MSKENGARMKKRLVVVIVVILAVLLILYVSMEILQYVTAGDDNKVLEETANYNFYPVDYSEDIYADEEYVALIQNGVIICNDSFNTGYTVDIDNLDNYDPSVQPLVEMIYSAIDGDVDGYNSCFSEKYFETNSPKERFTKQKIYSVDIRYFNSDTVTENGITYQKYEYELSYSIYKNNGTFRNDIGDGARKQLVTVTDRDGRLLVDSITAYQYK